MKVKKNKQNANIFLFKRSIDFIVFLVTEFQENRALKRKLFFCGFLIIAAKIFTALQPLLLGNTVDAISHKAYKTAFISLIMLGLAGLLGVALQILNNFMLSVLREILSETVVKKLLIKLQTFSHAFFFDKNSSQINAMTNNAQNAIDGFMMTFLSVVIPFFFELILVLTIIIYKVALYIIFPVVLIFIIQVLIGLYYAKKEKDSIKNIRDKIISKQKHFHEDIANFETIKIATAEKIRRKIISKHTSACVSAARNRSMVFLSKSLMQQITLYAGLIITLSITLFEVTKSNLSAGDFVMINAYFLQVTAPLAGVIRAYDMFIESSLKIVPLMELSKRAPDLAVIPPVVDTLENDMEINFDNVSFRYHKSMVIKNFNLRIPFKSKIVIVGKTGSGKSTIAKLIMRFYDVSEGKITINNHNIKHIGFSTLRNKIAYVPQDIVLLNDTIRNNIFLGHEETNTTMIDDFIHTDLLDFTKELELGLDTYVGNKGVRLSGGQKQRIGIVRALMRKPKLLVLDEYNSSIDINTEKTINRYLSTEKLDCSILIISHRLTVAKESDVVVVMKHGEIIAKGTHHDLLDQDAWYQKSWHNNRVR
ncbi:MAG: ABC transporter ATP-binding protein [Pseudomonadota bacterium]